uniref:Zinc/RING finger protein 3 n=1 Tax=Cajanus cajan TaxID=3821 RepID=A0A151SZT0_CAJCA|nr:Zinc/RING finger protein 3 [Cajanus cajan]
MFMKYLTSFYTYLKWVLNFLIYCPFYMLHDSQIPLIGEDQSICHYAPTQGSDEDVDCAICLSKIVHGEEIRVLRCEHLFHRKCLDTWVGLKFATCPL